VIAEIDDRDTYVCRPHAPGEIAAVLTGARLLVARRIGKSMWCETDAGVRLGLHLGMAGRIVVDDAHAGDPPDSAGHPDPAFGANPQWARFTMRFADGGTFLLFDKRRLGRVTLDPDLSGLGPDAARITRDAFRERVGRGDAPLKARIMDQAVLAGVGNLLADEALWRAKLSPVRPAGGLDDAELDRLRRHIRAATRDAIAQGGVHTGRMIPARRAGAACPRCGASMRRATVGGRTTWSCPVEQR
jgi:formamidopyrimidine-DNA glycosylase